MNSQSALIQKIRRGIKKPPSYIAKRLWHEAISQTERYRAPLRAKRFTTKHLLSRTNSASIVDLWADVGEQPFFANLAIDKNYLLQICPDNVGFIDHASQKALQHEIDLLGTGPIKLGDAINWHKDYKVGKTWANEFHKSIEYNNLDESSDVKIPWEISRMQWLIPCGQAFLNTKDEKYAMAVKGIISDWIAKNPYSCSINWACTMEVAIRSITWIWLFHVFSKSKSWQKDTNFQEQFLTSLYLHGDFTERNLEKSDVNGNHYIADAAGLVFTGLFFYQCKRAKRWQSTGWNILTKEILTQVSEDGVDYEASIPYHRLVTEIFLFPALYRIKAGLPIEDTYKQRLLAMANYIAHYSRQGGSSPIHGDADDARLLPFGEQPINDHRYLVGIIAATFQDDKLARSFSGSLSEIYWALDQKAINHLQSIESKQLESALFKEGKGGYCIIRNSEDHIFIDCAPIGLGGRGGHGHNDCLSFEATLLGKTLIVDSGCYVYTASPQQRNQFRSTMAHNTPIIDSMEINRFISPNMLWNMHYDAKPLIKSFIKNSEKTVFIGSHQGYMRLPDPVSITRTFELSHKTHKLFVQDSFSCKEKHKVITPIHFAPGAKIKQMTNDTYAILMKDKKFTLQFNIPEAWKVRINHTFYAPSYGIKESNLCLEISGSLDKESSYYFTLSSA